MAEKKTVSARRKKSPAPAQEVYTPKPAKSGLKAGTWLTLAVFVILVGAAVYLNRTKPEAETDAESTPAAEPAFAFNAGGPVSAIEIQLPDGVAVRVAREADGIWAVEMPEQGAADQAMAEAAASQITAIEVLSSIEGQPVDFGLESPTGTILAEFQDGSEHTLDIGDATPTGRGYYAQLDKSELLIVGFDGVDSLFQLVTNPPYAATPDPAVTPSP